MVSFVPIPIHAPHKDGALFDHLVGMGEQRLVAFRGLALRQFEIDWRLQNSAIKIVEAAATATPPKATPTIRSLG